MLRPLSSALHQYLQGCSWNQNDRIRLDQSQAFLSLFIKYNIKEKIYKLFRSTGKSYIRLAQEEPHLFRIFILHQREGISSLNDLYQAEANPHTAEAIAKELNINVERAKQLHLNMLIYTIGIGTIFSVTTPGISTDEIYTQQEVAYEAFLKQALRNEE